MLNTETLPAVRGEIVTPGDPEWDLARRAWNLAADQRPALVALPEDAGDVVAIVEYARAAGLKVAPQGTGHNAPAIATLEDTILVSTQRMRGVEIDAEAQVARVQAGTLWLEVTEASTPYGLFPLSGSSPDVGVVGYTLGGGLSWLARKHGLSANNVVADRARHARRRARPGDRRRPRRAVLGAARRRRQLRRRHRHGARACSRLRRGLRRHVPVALRAPRRGAARVARVDAHGARGGHDVVPDHPPPAAARAAAVPVGPLRGRRSTAPTPAAPRTAPRRSPPLRALEPEIDTWAPSSPDVLSRIHMDPEEPMPVPRRDGAADRPRRGRARGVRRADPSRRAGAVRRAAPPRRRGRPRARGRRRRRTDAGRVPDVRRRASIMGPESAAAGAAGLARLKASLAPYATGKDVPQLRRGARRRGALLRRGGLRPAARDPRGRRPRRPHGREPPNPA